MAFAALCLLSGSSWLLGEAWTSPFSGLTRIVLHNALLGVLFGIASLRFPRSGLKVIFGIAGWGAALLAVPLLLFEAAQGKVSSYTEVLIFTLVPAVVVFLEGQQATFGLAESPLTLLAPALAGVAGAALLIPFALPTSTAGILWLVALVFAAALAGVATARLYSLTGRTSTTRVAAILCGGTALACLGFMPLDWRPPVSLTARDAAIEVASCLLVDGPVLLLSAWLLAAMRPVAFSARYLLIPLITIGEGFALVRPGGTWTAALGMVLLGAGGLVLWAADEEAPR